MESTYIVRDGRDVAGWAYTTDVSKLFRGRPTHLVNQIFVAESRRGKGYGTELLTLLTTDADAEKTSLILDFQPGEFSSDATRLQLFYERFGFTWDNEIGGMRREPQ